MTRIPSLAIVDFAGNKLKMDGFAFYDVALILMVIVYLGCVCW